MADEPLDLEQAISRVLAHARPLARETMPLRRALGCTLAEDVVAEHAVPPFDDSAMDGFAVRAADTASPPTRLHVVGESRAGHPAARDLERGEAVAISTGAMLPGGADAVVRAERASRRNGEVTIEASARAGQDIRLAGEDLAPGAIAIERGTVLGPAELGVLASLGRAEISCHQRPRVAVLTSGDELLEPGEPTRPGSIYDTNSHTIPALAERAGATVISVDRVRDDPEATRDAIEATLRADVAIVCGGVSVGEHDHVKQGFAWHDVRPVFWRLALKPGGPAWFGTRKRTLAFGLPGNPVSAMVVFQLLVRPALAGLAGVGAQRHTRTRAVLEQPCERAPRRLGALRCALALAEDGWHATPAPRQGSHVLTSMLGADALALIPPGEGKVAAGERVEVELL
ncbi:MAG TPA: gephyrin-like molybdotransferase Glp [Solirubrobacterales bacterium]|nr:gephyrin-like molybdotransferase Glp [Solirubrobacterales bacterium]